MYVSMWNNLPKYSLSIPLFIFCPRSESCGIYSEILAFTWKRERHPFSRNYHLFTTLPHRITFLLYPSRRSALKKMFCKWGGFELCGKRGGKPRVGGVEEKKTRWSELRSRDCLWKRAVSSKWSARGREKKQPLRFVSPCTSSELISSLFVFITVGAKVKDVRSVKCTGDISSVCSDALVHNFIMVCVE